MSSASQDQTAIIWDWNITENSVDCIHVCRGHERGLECVSVNNDKTMMATGAWDTMLKIWSTCKYIISIETVLIDENMFHIH